MRTLDAIGRSLLLVLLAAGPPACGDGGAEPGGVGESGSGGSITTTDGGTESGFWGDTTSIPAATQVMTFRFLNRTNGKFADAQVYWSFQNSKAGIDEVHSIAEMPTYEMPVNASGRMYFYIVTSPADPPESAAAPRKSHYYDFIEHTIGATAYHGNTTRVDAFGLKISMRLHCKDGYDATVGEDQATFAETREQTFAKFLAEVPAEFAHLAQPPFAPYRIVQPWGGEFKAGGAEEHYYDAWIDELWASNGITAAKAGANCSPIDQPDLSAACFRHVGAGQIQTDGHVKTGVDLWVDGATFYPSAPANYYAKFWHTHAIDGRAYGFPYDDVGGWSSYVSHDGPQWLVVAIGW
jgi:hypothetical protein